MNVIRTVLNRFSLAKIIHWKLLLLLLLFLDVKLIVKLVAVLLIYILQPDFQFGFRLKSSRLPLFYPLVMVIALLDTLLYQHAFQLTYVTVLLLGMGMWMACILIVHQLKLIVERTDAQIIYQTLIVFFLLNACVSAFQYIRIVMETGVLNPFRYQGNYQKYFISTGDYIKGLSFDTCTTNAILNAFGIIYFLFKRNWAMVLLCTGTLLFTGSNLVNILLFLTLFLLFVFRTSKEQKSMIVVCSALLVVFITKISPQNNEYVLKVFRRIFQVEQEGIANQQKPVDVRQLPDSVLSIGQEKEKIALLYLDSLRNVFTARDKKPPDKLPTAQTSFTAGTKPSIPEPSIHSAPFQNRDDSNAYRKELLQFNATKNDYKIQDEAYSQTTLPGKAIACLQTANYFLQHPSYLLTGAGLGNFSSKMAFKATALKFAGGFPERLAYINPAFSANHLSLYTYFFSKRANAHSITNTPNSVYDQLISEYGIIGLVAFFIFYVGFFVRHYKKLTYGIPLLFLLLSFFFIDYWFEQLSIVIMFELLLFLNLKETQQA